MIQLFQVGIKRSFSHTRILPLLYKRTTPIKKAPTPELKVSVGEMEDIQTIKSLKDNKIYQRTPLILKPHMRNILTRPYAFVFSIVALQQVFTILPFLSLWYVFDTWSIQPPSLPQDMVVRALEMMHNGLINWDDQMGSREKAELAGANAYVMVKLLTPAIWVAAIGLAPLFDRYVLRSITRLFKRKPKAISSKPKENIKQ